MTFRELHKRFDQQIDKAGGATFQPREKDRILNAAVDEVVSKWAVGVERNATFREALRGLTRPPVVGQGKVVALSALPKLYRILALEAHWGRDEDNLPDWVAARPVATETLARRRRSWIHALDDERPGYTEQTVEAGSELLIHSTSDPDGWRVHWLGQPQVIDGWTKPNEVWRDFPQWAEAQVLAVARRMAYAELGEPGGYQISQAEEAAVS